MICFKILYRHILKVSMPSECQTSYNTLKSLFHHLCKWCEQCAYNIDLNSFHITLSFWYNMGSLLRVMDYNRISNTNQFSCAFVDANATLFFCFYDFFYLSAFFDKYSSGPIITIYNFLQSLNSNREITSMFLFVICGIYSVFP